MLKNLFLFNWRPKLGSLLLAILLWAALKNQIEPGFLDQLFLSLGWHPG